jgi:acyl-CoA reductase-like NAD-dependent aldehyde dehydrogenase
MKIAGQLRTGVTFFNNHNATAVDERAPFGGFNASGIGRELGRQGCTNSPRPTSWPSPPTARTRQRVTRRCARISRHSCDGDG